MARRMILLALHRHFGVVAAWVLWRNDRVSETTWWRRRVNGQEGSCPPWLIPGHFSQCSSARRLCGKCPTLLVATIRVNDYEKAWFLNCEGSMTRILFAFGLIALLTACNVTKTPVATGGSRADASIEMSYDVGGFETVTPDWSAAQTAATERCQAWGFSKAEGFEGISTQCNAFNAYGCVNETVTRTYQCLD